MMRPITFIQIMFTVLICLFSTASWAAPKESSVIVEIDTVDLTKEKVEKVISDPVEVLLGSLEGVLVVSAEYQTNKAVIDVRFSQEAVDPDSFVKQVRTLIDTYLDKLPDNIDSISVSQGEASEPEDVSVKVTPKPESPLFSKPSKVLDEPGVIRSVAKRIMAGRFLGSIESSNEFLPIITNLIVSRSISDNADSGNYFMSESDAIVPGELSDCYKSTASILTCQWRDKYGMGGVEFMFTPDYSAFSGRWSISGQEGAYKWSGMKVKEK